MSLIDSILLGIIQGLTEFLPVSSSGHLALFEHFLHVNPGDLSFEVTVHAGTLLAVIIYFRRKLFAMVKSVLTIRTGEPLLTPNRRLILFIILGTIPAVVIGLLFKDTIEEIFASPRIAALLLMVTGLWLLTIRFVATRTRPLSWSSSWWIGVAQSIAILPGISRSGSTIATGMMMGIEPTVAAEFSFLLSIPAVFGAVVLALPDAIAIGEFGMAHWLGGITAGFVGYWALRLVFATLRRGRFGWFGAYCLVAGAVASWWLLLNP